MKEKKLPDDIRLHCGVRPVLIKTFYPNTHYAMVRIVCPVCNNGTGDKRRIIDAVNEWEHPSSHDGQANRSKGVS